MYSYYYQLLLVSHYNHFIVTIQFCLSTLKLWYEASINVKKYGLHSLEDMSKQWISHFLPTIVLNDHNRIGTRQMLTVWLMYYRYWYRSYTDDVPRYDIWWHHGHESPVPNIWHQQRWPHGLSGTVSTQYYNFLCNFILMYVNKDESMWSVYNAGYCRVCKYKSITSYWKRNTSTTYKRSPHENPSFEQCYPIPQTVRDSFPLQ